MVAASVDAHLPLASLERRIPRWIRRQESGSDGETWSKTTKIDASQDS